MKQMKRSLALLLALLLCLSAVPLAPTARATVTSGYNFDIGFSASDTTSYGGAYATACYYWVGLDLSANKGLMVFQRFVAANDEAMAGLSASDRAAAEENIALLQKNLCSVAAFDLEVEHEGDEKYNSYDEYLYKLENPKILLGEDIIVGQDKAGGSQAIENTYHVRNCRIKYNEQHLPSKKTEIRYFHVGGQTRGEGNTATFIMSKEQKNNTPPFIFGADTFSFANTASSFKTVKNPADGQWHFQKDGAVQMTQKYYNMLIAPEDQPWRNMIAALLNQSFEGCCEGMSITAGLLKNESIKIGQIDTGAEVANDLPKPANNQALQDAIMYYQLIQNTQELKTFTAMKAEPDPQNAIDFVKIANSCALFSIRWFGRDGKLRSHAMLSLKSHKFSWGDTAVLCYDPNTPEEPLLVTVSADGSEVTYSNPEYKDAWIKESFKLSSSYISSKKFQESLTPVTSTLPQNSAVILTNTGTVTFDVDGQKIQFKDGKKVSGGDQVEIGDYRQEPGADVPQVRFFMKSRPRGKVTVEVPAGQDTPEVDVTVAITRDKTGEGITVDAQGLKPGEGELSIDDTATEEIVETKGPVRITVASSRSKGSHQWYRVVSQGGRIVFIPLDDGFRVKAPDGGKVTIIPADPDDPGTGTPITVDPGPDGKTYKDTTGDPIDVTAPAPSAAPSASPSASPSAAPSASPSPSSSAAPSSSPSASPCTAPSASPSGSPAPQPSAAPAADIEDFTILEGEAIGYRGKGGDLTIPGSISAIGRNVFAYNSDLTAVTVPGSVERIKERAFYSCKNLKTVVMLFGVREIENSAFAFCDSLTDIYIPASVTVIDDNALANRTSVFAPTIHGAKGSAAETFAAKKGFLFQADLPEPAAPIIVSVGVDPLSAGTAIASGQDVYVGSSRMHFQAYALQDVMGNQTNYVKVRDVAAALDGTKSQFNVDWDDTDKVVDLITGKAYTTRNGQENRTPYSGNRRYEKATAATKVNGMTVGIHAFVLKDDSGNGSTYYKLRDLGQALGFNVGWSRGKGIYIEPGVPYTTKD